MITSVQNPLIKQVRKLHHAKGRREQDLFLIEGTHLIETAVRLRSLTDSRVNCSLVTIFYTQKWQNRYPQLWENLSRQAQRLELVSEDVLSAIATTVHPDGVVATASRFFRQTPPLPPLTPPVNGGGRVEGEVSSLSLGIMVERLQDPGNLGTIIRTSVATEVDGLWLTDDSVDIDNPKVLRSSAGEWFRLPIYITDNLAKIIQEYQTQGVQVIATLPHTSKTYWQVDFTRPSLIVLGNEGAGLSQDLIRLADEKVTIPLGGQVESLNVAIAASLLLYEAKRQRMNHYL